MPSLIWTHSDEGFIGVSFNIWFDWQKGRKRSNVTSWGSGHQQLVLLQLTTGPRKNLGQTGTTHFCINFNWPAHGSWQWSWKDCCCFVSSVSHYGTSSGSWSRGVRCNNHRVHSSKYIRTFLQPKTPSPAAGCSLIDRIFANIFKYFVLPELTAEVLSEVVASIADRQWTAEWPWEWGGSSDTGHNCAGHNLQQAVGNR